MADSLFKELKRRNVIKVGVAYLILAWVVVQVSSTAVPALHLPEWINTAVFFFGMIGFPFALFFAWAFEVTPDGVKRESEIVLEESITSHTGRNLNFIIIGLLSIGMSYFIWESRFASTTDEVVVTETASQKQPDTNLKQEPEGSSIAVLAFDDMSPDKDQEYLSDGISEEILNVLAKLPHLKVTSRSSAFSFKGKEIIISEVAKKLGVKNILEGSVRKAGNRIRITAQLIEAKTDTHLWSETYDRELTDIFAIQDEISAAIVEALKSKLGLDAKVTSRDMSKVNLDAHNEYLKGRFYVENRTKADLEKALAHFEKAIEFAPEYASAWMGKGWASLFLGEPYYGNIPLEVAIERARPAIDKALQLDPSLPEAYGILGQIELSSFEIDKSIALYKKAIELNPNYADAYSWYSTALFDQPKKQLELAEKSVQLSPMSILTNANYAHGLIDYGRIDQAREIAEHLLTINASHPFPYLLLGRIQSIEGDYAEAAVSFNTAKENSPEATGAKFRLANLLATIGLIEQAGSAFEDSEFVVFKYYFEGNTELFISQARELYPRNENDSIGLIFRAQVESFAGDYKEAVKYYKLTKFGETSDDRIYSYQQVGETESAEAIIDKAKSQLSPRIDAKVEYWGSSPIEIRVMNIAYLEGDIEKAIFNLKLAMDKKYIISFEYVNDPMYKKLRQHPDWPILLTESDRRAAIQREKYLKLVAP